MISSLLNQIDETSRNPAVPAPLREWAANAHRSAVAVFTGAVDAQIAPAPAAAVAAKPRRGRPPTAPKGKPGRKPANAPARVGGKFVKKEVAAAAAAAPAAGKPVDLGLGG